MRRFLRLCISSLLLFYVVACQSNAQQNTAAEEALGDISARFLLSEYPGFKASYQDYQPTDRELSAVKSLKGKSLVVMFGTWCHDSQNEVPRLLKLLDTSGVDLQTLQLVAVNTNKQDPAGLYRQLALRYTPTVVLFNGATEIGRIIEHPQTTWGEDLAVLVNNQTAN